MTLYAELGKELVRLLLKINVHANDSRLFSAMLMLEGPDKLVNAFWLFVREEEELIALLSFKRP